MKDFIFEYLDVTHKQKSDILFDYECIEDAELSAQEICNDKNFTFLRIRELESNKRPQYWKLKQYGTT